MMYNTTAQSVLLCGSESWLVKGYILKILEGFHHQEARRITGMKAKNMADGDWEYTPVAAALVDA